MRTPFLIVASLLLLSATTPAQADDKLALLAAERGADYSGKVVVVDFWASWCVPCRRSFPWMNAMLARYEDRGLVIIAVNLDNERDEAERFLADYPADFTVHFDATAEFAKQFGVEAMPSSFIFGRDGELKARHLGFKVRSQDEYEAVLVKVLEEET